MMQQHFPQPHKGGTTGQAFRLVPGGHVDRTHMVVDLENVCGGSDAVAAHSLGAYNALSSVIPMDRAQVVVAVGIHAWMTSPHLGFQWPNARFLVGRGIDGADLRLMEDLVEEPQARRSRCVAIVSGDGRFTEAAVELRDAGVEVLVVAHAHNLSRRLREAASNVLYLPPIAA